MAIDLRNLFDELRVPWKDRGANTNRRNVNICCPWCGDDQGFHLGVAEADGKYYCFRRPTHSGSNPIALLTKLGQKREGAVRLHNRHLVSGPVQRQAAEPKPAAIQNKAWLKFRPALDCDRMLDYLESRGFDHPVTVAERYDLRYMPYGRFAWRLLMPIQDAGSVVAWTGRTIQRETQPKYLTESSGREGLVYMPRPARDVLVICEGPLDALKLAVAGERLPVAAVALTGKQLNSDRLGHLLRAAEGSTRILLCLDQDTALWEGSRMLGELQSAFSRRAWPERIKLPEDVKDPGEMPVERAFAWLKGACGRA